MASYWVTFRLHNNASYDARYEAFYETLNDVGSGFWDAPTSFIAIETALGIGDLSLQLKAAVDPRVDLVVIREIGKDSTRFIGDPGPGFLHFFPTAKKV